MKRILCAIGLPILIAVSCLSPARAYEIKGQVADYAVPRQKPLIMQNLAKNTPSPAEVHSYIVDQCQKNGVNIAKCAWIVSHESQDGRNMRGDDQQSRGYWMISRVWHPEVSDACADDLQCSTAWSIKRILDGYIDEWSTMKFCRVWYKDCPF